MSGGGIASKTFNVRFTVTLASVDLSIGSANINGFTIIFSEKQYGYSSVSSLPLTITNTGTAATGGLTVALSGLDADSFTLSATSFTSLNPQGMANLIFAPNTGLDVRTHSATITVNGTGIVSKSFNISFTVKSASTGTSNIISASYTEGQTLSDITPPEGWAWESPDILLTEGMHTYKAVFIDDEKFIEQELTVNLTMIEANENDSLPVIVLMVCGLIILGIVALSIRGCRRQRAKKML